VEEKQIFEGAKDFCTNFPKLAQKVVVQILPTVFWCDLQNMVFTCFSANVGRHISSQTILGTIFAQIFKDFA